MKIIKTTFDEVTDLVANILVQQKETCVYCISDENCAIVGSNGGSNLNAIENLNVRLIQINHEGGTIVASPGDVQIGIFTEGYVGDIYRDLIISKIITKLKENGHNPQLVQNDLLINGKKVLGFGSRMFGNILYTAIQISIDINIDLIQSICSKQMIKIPDGLKNYGITTQDIIDILFDTIPIDEFEE